VGGTTVRELKYYELRKFYDANALGFETTDDLTPNSGLIGQSRAADALKFGLAVKAYGYNVFVSGVSGTGKTTFARKFAEQAAEKGTPPNDMCYVYNFEEPKYPKLLSLKNGFGVELKSEMEGLLTRICDDIPTLFSSEEFEDEKHSIVKVLHDKREEAIANITKYAKENGFGVKSLNAGVQFLPIINDEMINEEQYETLSAETKADITSRSETITRQSEKTLRKIKGFEAETNKKVEELEQKFGTVLIDELMADALLKFESEPDVLQYFSQIKEDVLANMGDFIEAPEQGEEELLQLMPWAAKRGKDESFNKYKVNLIAHTKGSPVVLSHNPTHTNLVGEIEYENEMGNLTTDFMKIKPGLLHKANGGYLVLQANDLLTNYHAWETLKLSLRTKEIAIEPCREFGGGFITATLKPEPAVLDVKVILVGSSWCYDLLYEFDDDFKKLFKIHSEFDYEMSNDADNLIKLARFVKCFADENNSKAFDKGAVARLAEYSVRMAENQTMLSTQFGYLADILTEAAAWAGFDDAKIIKDTHISKAITERNKRLNMYEEKLNNLINRDVLMLDTDGAKTAQINGLAVLESGGYAFAKPSRITATAYVGKAGIVNIEKEAEMSGSIHDKGVEVLTGYLGQKYAQEFPLSLSCRVCFEQNYNGVDGDSASSTELYAILSSLANLPIKQSLAVTGSINQRGEIQPIGGVTHKIEGFFTVCNKRGLTGEQGVIIPEQNTQDLSLSDEVIDAVKNGKFHIYAITTADEGIELLMGTTAGVVNENGKYPTDTVHGKVFRKLRDFYKRSIQD